MTSYLVLNTDFVVLERPANSVNAPMPSSTFPFAEILARAGRTLHVGCVTAVGPDWIQVSAPPSIRLDRGIQVRLNHRHETHHVTQHSRGTDRVRLTYIAGSAKANLKEVLHFAELVSADGHRIHVGCVMAVGADWVEVSVPQQLTLANLMQLRLHPTPLTYEVETSWRAIDRVGLVYTRHRPASEALEKLLPFRELESAMQRRFRKMGQA